MDPLRRPCCHHVRLPNKRAAGLVGWIMPSVLLVLMPKCPACFAAYIALVSGVGLSLPVAAGLRFALITLCGLSLFFLIGRKCLRFFRRHSEPG